jgi:SAM-dependent methyltransferase
MAIDHWCRIVMNEETARLVRELAPSNLDVLEISGTAWSNFGFRSYETLAWPAFDICKDRLAKNFDLIIAEQVFEHVRYPAQAARNVYRMLRAGATFLITTPFMIRIHPMPGDFWRWTPSGLEALLEDAGFVSIRVGDWGNRSCVTANLADWPMFDPERHSLVAEPDVPLVVWATAKRDN